MTDQPVPSKRPKSYIRDGKKFCLECKTEKPFDEFNPNKRSADGLQPYCRVCTSIKSAQWRQANKEKVTEYNAEYRQENKEYYQQYNKDNKEMIQVSVKKWRENNPEMLRASSVRTATRRRFVNDTVDDGTVTNEFMLSIYATTHCYYCKNFTDPSERTQDHRIPLVRGGAHSASNIVMACNPCNCKKHTMTDVEYLAKIGEL